MNKDFELSYANYRLENITINITRLTNKRFAFVHLKFSQLYIEDFSVDKVVDKLHFLIRKKLEKCSLAEIDLFFNQFLNLD